MEYRSQRLSDVLVNMVDSETSDETHLQLGTMVDTLGGRVYGVLFILFGLPNILPIPGLPVLCGIVLSFLGVQLFLRKPSPWLPARLRDIRLAKADLARIITRAFPFIVKIESYSKARFDWLATHDAVRPIGLVVLALGISLIVIPVPFIGSIFQGFAIVFLGLGLLERDGLIVIIGYFLSLIATLVVSAIAFALIFGVKLLF